MGPCIGGLGARPQGQAVGGVAGRVIVDVVIGTRNRRRVGIDGCRHRRLLDSSGRMRGSPRRIRAWWHTVVVHGINRLRRPTAARCEFHLLHQDSRVTWVGGLRPFALGCSYAPSRMSRAKNVRRFPSAPKNKSKSYTRGRRCREIHTPIATL